MQNNFQNTNNVINAPSAFKAWYDTLILPSWTPAPGVIGLIWSLLYPLITALTVYASYKVYKGEMSKIILIPIAISWILNFAFVFFQMRLLNNTLALADIVLMLISIIFIVYFAYSKSNLTNSALSLSSLGGKFEAKNIYALLWAPYLIWVSIATVLQSTIWWLNR